MSVTINNNRCEHCGGTLFVDQNDYARMEKTSLGYVTIGLSVSCGRCGWKGVEHYRLTHMCTTTTSAPAVMFDVRKLIEVVSSVIHKIGYDPKEGHLAIQFVSDNHIYVYKVESATVFIELLNAESKGRYYSDNIKGRYNRLDSKR